MRKCYKTFGNLLAFCIFVCSLVCFASCGDDSGLGSVIDTKAPTLSIDYPPSGASIRDTFILEGSCSDDISISAVMVTVKNLDTGETVGTFPAVVNPLTLTWSLNINAHNPAAPNFYNGWQYPDGKYEVSVVAYDFAGNNSGTNSRSFELDNTPPVFIISNPGVVKKSGLSASAYGSVFTIDGTIADNHTISFMDVKIFDANGVLVSSESYEGENIDFYREEEIPTAGGTSVQIAQFGNARYTQLHPSDAGTEYYYAQISVTDSTQCYQNPPVGSLRTLEQIAADKIGNNTSKLYLYDDVYSTLMSAKKGINSANGGLSAANLKDILAGIRKGDIETRALEILNEKAIDTSVPSDSDEHGNKLSFSLNPQANPTYNVNGFAFGFGDDEITQSASTGNTISVTVNAGLDGTNIAPGVIKVWMKTYESKPTDAVAIKNELNSLEKKVEALEKDEQTFMDLTNKTAESPATVVDGWSLVYDYSLNNAQGSSVATKTFSVTLPEGIELGKYYILGVTGYDIEDVVFSQSTVYGFEGNTAGVPPTINIDTPDNLSVWKDFVAPSFSGSASISTSALYITELTATLSLTDENNNNALGEFSDKITCKLESDSKVWTESEKHALTWNSDENKWDLDLSKIPELVQFYNDRAGAGVYWLATLKLSGKSSSGHEGESTRSIHIDTVAPVISLTSITPIVSGADYFGGGDTETYVNGIITIKGNVEEQNLLDTEDAVTYDILASTDGSAPVSILSQLIARKDELGVAFDGKLGKTFSLSIPFDTRAITKFFYQDGDGKIQTEVVVTATDKAGNTTSYSSKTLNGGKNYIIYQETDRPKIDLGNADASIVDAASVKVNKNLFGTTSNNRIQINFTDDDDIAEYEFYLYNEAGTLMGASEVKAQSDGSTANPYKFTPGKTTATLNYILPSVEAKYQVEIKARDYLATALNTANPYGEKTVGRFFVAVDSGAPEIEISTPVAGSFQSSNVSIVGTVSKSVELTGTLQKGGVNVVDPFTIPASDLTLDSSTGLYSFSKTVTVTENDAYVIGISATDIYDQNATKSRVFKVDTQSPVIQSVATAGHLTTTNTERLIPLDEMEYLTLNADVTDGDPTAVSGISVVKYYITTNSTVDLAATPFDGNDWLQMNQGQTNDSYVTSFNANVAVKKFATEKGYYDGLVYIFVATKDNAGNPVAVSSPITLTFDKTVPKLTVKNFAGNTDLENNGTSTTTNPSATFNVNIEDTNIASLTSDNTAVVVGSTPDEITGGKRYTITPSWNVDSSSGKYEDEKTVTFTAKDTYYREAKKTVTLKCDNWAPRVELPRTSGDTFSKSNALELKGTIKDKNVTGVANNLKLSLVPIDSAFESKEGLVTFSPLANGEAGYNYTANITGLNDTEYNVAIVAEDSFGNKSYYSTDASKTTTVTGDASNVPADHDLGDSISIDSTAPLATVELKVSNASGDAKVLNNGKGGVDASSTDTEWNTYYSDKIKFDSKYYTNRTFTISGKITEVNIVNDDADSYPGTSAPSLTIVKEDSTGRNSVAVGAGEFVVNYAGRVGNDIPWSFTKTYAENGDDDGLYEYTLEVWDKSKQQFKKTITVVLDTKKPELSITNPSDGESFDATKPAVKISYSDEGVGVDTDTTDSSNYIVKIFNITELADSTSIDTFNSETPLAPSEFTILSSSATTRLENLTAEGAFRVFAQVRDNLGHTSAVETRRFSYDSNPPSITEDNVGNGGLKTNGYADDGSIANSLTEGLTVKNFMLSGSVSDTNALYNNGNADTNGKTAVRITASKDGASAGEWKIPLTVTDKRNATWKQVFVIGSENSGNTNPSYIYLADGVYTFSIVATDIADKETAITRTVTVDTVKPVIASPVINAQTFTFGSGTTEEIWYNSDSIGIGGSANDGTDGTGIQKVYYKTTGDNGTTWSNVTTLAGTSSWSGTVGGLVSKTTKIRVIAVDNAGNESDPYDFGTFNIDTTEPSAENASMTFASGDGMIFDSSKTEVKNNTLIFEKTYYTGNAFTLSGEFTELNVDTSTGNAPTLSVSKDGDTATSVTLNPVQVPGTNDRWTWTYNSPNDIADGSNDGTYKYTLTVTDKVNHVLTKSFEVVVDTKAPTLTIESPIANEAFSKAPTVQVSYSDVGVGINTNEIEYEIYKITDTSSETKVSVSGQKTAGSENGKFKFDDSFNDESNEGKYKVTAKIKDYLGHESTVASQTFFFDKNKPVLSDINIGLSGLQTNGLADDGTKPNGLNVKNFKLSGRVSDSNALYDNGTYHSSTTEKNVITISASKGGTSVGSWNIPVTLDDSGNSKKSGSWEKIFVVGSDTLPGYDQLADGTYTFTITALDVVEKDAIETRTVTVDTQAPTLSTPAVATQPGNNGWYKTDELRFTGTSGDGTGTGVQTVYYQTSTNGIDWSGSKTTTAFAGTSTWSGTVPSLVSGSTIVRIVAVDNAGNESISDELGPYNIDMVAPNSDDVKLNFASGATGMVVNSSKQSETATDGKYTLAFGNTYYTGTAFTLSGEFVEENIYSATLTRKKNSETEATTITNWSYASTGAASEHKWAWTYTVPAFAANNADDGQYEYTLTIEDKVGFRFSKSVFVIVDTKAPELSVTTPAEGEKFMSAPTAQISYSDDGVGINTAANSTSSSISYEVLDITDSTTGTSVDTTSFTRENKSTTASLKFSNTFTNEGSFKLRATVSDYLGHTKTTEWNTFYIDLRDPEIKNVNIGASGLTTNGLAASGGSGTSESDRKFVLSGDVYDSNALFNNGNPVGDKTGIKISTEVPGEAAPREWNVTLNRTDKKNASWSKEFTVGSGSGNDYLPDGTYILKIEATDVTGKTSQVSRTVTVDTTAPTFGTKNFSDGDPKNFKPRISTETAGSLGWYATDELRFHGTSSDGDTGTGVQSVYYETSTYDGSTWSAWTGSKTTTAFAGTSSWAGTVADLESGKTKVRVVVVDNAENKTISDVFGPFDIDMIPPTSTIGLAIPDGKKLLDSSKQNADTSNIAFGSTYYTNGKFTLSGTITELNIDDGNKPVLRIVKDSTTTPVNLTENNPDSTTGTWTYTQASGTQGQFDWTYTIPDLGTDHARDGQYVYTLTFKDKVGNTFEKSITVIVDTKAPDASITAPGDGDQFLATNLPVAKIAYSDDGVGIDTSSTTAIKYIVKNITESTPGTDVDTSNYSVNNRSATGQATFESSFNAEGSFTVYAEVKDYLGHSAQTETRTFYYDINPPTLTETKVGSNGITTNGLEATGGTGTEAARKFTLEGTVSDSNALYDNGNYHETGDNVIVISTNEKLPNGTTRTRTWNVELESGSTKKSGTWKKDFIIGSGEGVDTTAENYLPDGTYTFSIKATDVAGKNTLESRTVKVDTVAPVFGSGSDAPHVSTDSKLKGSTKWYKTNSLRVEGTASDVGGTGINKVYYQIQTTSGATYESTETAFAGTESWGGTVDGLDTGNKIRVIVVDNAGNASAPVELESLYIDMTEPVLVLDSEHKVKVNNAEVSEENPFYSKGAKDVEATAKNGVTFNVSDETGGSGVEKVYVQLYNKVTDAQIEASATTVLTATLQEDGSYKAEIPVTQITKSGTVYARIYDYAGNASDVNLFALTYDTTDPKIISPVLEEKTANFKAYKTKDENGKEFYYVNNGQIGETSTYHTFKLSGVATDNLGLSKITLSITDGTTTLDTVEIVDNPATTDKDELADWNFDNIDLHTLSGDNTKATLTLYDKAGNKAESIISIKYDRAVPAGKHEYIDSVNKTKDYVFRIGDGVGGKYSPGTYGNNTTIMIRGYFTEPLSGLSMLYYKVLQTPPTQAEADSFLADYTNGSTGFAALSTVKKVNVPSSDIGEIANVESNFETTVSSFEEGNNYLLLVAVDNVGNAALDTATIGSGSNAVTGCYSINVDVKAPEIEASNMEAHLTNGESDIVITGTAKDNPSGGASGIKSIVASVKVGETEYKSSDATPEGEAPKIKVEPNPVVTGAVIETSDSSEFNWKVTIDKSVFEAATLTSGNFTVYATVTDKAGEKGNSQTSNIGTITVDKVLDEVVLTAPSDADKTTTVREINGTINLSGTVKDTNPLPDTAIVGIQYVAAPLDAQNKARAFADLPDAEKSALAWTTLTNSEKTAVNGDMTNLSLSGNYTFDINNFDTTKIEPKNDVAYFIRAKAQDKAGNIGYSAPVAVTISQDSDRPVVKITNLNEVTDGAYSYILKYGTKSQVIATVSDDDGIDEVYISESPYEGTGTVPTTSVYVPTTGTLTFTPSADTTANGNVDGKKEFYIYVKDTEGSVFYTTRYGEDDSAAASSSGYLNVPKIRVNDTLIANEKTVSKFVYFSDSTSPEVGIINALAYKAGENATSAGAVNGGLNNTTSKYTEYEGVNASYVIGGTERQWVQFKISASDASGIAGIYMEISYKDKSDVPQTIKRRTSASVGTEGTVSDADTFVAAKEADGTTDSRTTKIWTTDKISFANAKGNISVKIIPYDASGLQGNGQVTFVADTTGPEIKVTSPEPTDEVTGTVSVVGISTDQGGSKTASTKWLIPTRTQRKMTDADALYSATKDLWLETGFTAKSTASSWTFELKSSEISVYDTDGSDNASGTDTGYAQSVADGVYILPFYVLSTDELGNRTIKRDYTIKHNPDADRPKTTISYPDQSGRTLGGTIRVTGESIIPAGEATVKAVYLQIGTVTDGVASFDDAAKTKASAAVNMVSGVNNGGYHYTVKTPADVKSDNGFATDLNFGAGVSSSAWWGIPVTKTSSAWNFSLNANGELDPASGETNHIAIRACAVNSEGKVGAWSTTYFVDVDSTAPTQIATLRQFASGGENAFSTTSIDSNLSTTKASAIRSYEAEMYLKGNWYLTVQLDDESLLDSYSVKKGNQTLTSGYYASSKTWTYSDDTTSTGDTATAGKTVKHVSRTIFIPVDKTDEKVDYTVTVTDSNETGGHTINAVYSLRIDNTAPSITKIYKGSDSENSPVLTQNYTVNDENYIFTLGGKVTENGSGFERVVFYYVRENDASKTYNRQAILDPLVTSASGTADSKAYLFVDNGSGADGSTAILTKRTFTQDSEHSYDLWALAVNGKMKADGYTFVADSSLSDNKHIRTGGLIEVGGVLRRIESISGTTVVFDSNTGVTADSDTTAYFPYAQVVDNTNTEKTESTSANPFTFQSGDDGDEMPETVSGSKSTGYLWDSSVHTTNIPDGPAKLVVLVFDKAGNVSGQTYTVKVENSAPRLAKVFLGTDLNSNDSWQANEFVGYDLYNANETYGITNTEVKASQTIQTANYGSAFTIKDKLAVVAEFVGGNGDIIMVYGKDAADATAVPSTGTGAGVSATENTTITGLISATDKIGSVTYNKKTVTTSLKGFTLTSKQVVGLADTATIAETNDGTGKTASFTFWDSTEELVQGSTSQNCVLYVTDFAIDLHDGLAPKTVINPFYWQSLNSNSIYGSSDENNVSSVGDLQGHIELESDWTATDSTGKLTSWDGKGIAGGTALDADPKVSGKITFTGTAYDEHALSKLTATFGNVLSSVDIATYHKGNSKWTVAEATIGTDGYEVTVTDAGKTYSYDGSQKTTTSTDSAYGVFKDTAYFGQKGHKVYWTLSIDTEKLSTKVGADISLNVIAKDLSNNTTVATEVSPTISEGYIPGQELSTSVTYTVNDGTTNKPSYTVDVVPYITEVKTSLSSLKSGNPSVYTRTALGHYTVRSDEQVDFVGFNLGDGASLSIATRDTSGNYDFEVSGIKALNNLNTNNSRGAYKSAISDSSSYNVKNNYAYNRLPNNDNNNLLTDDIWFDIWEFNNRAAVPITGKIEQPVMKIRPTDGKIGFAFVNGPLYFSMGGSQSSQDYSYQYWAGSYDLWSSIGFTYDSFGNSYGVGAGGDSNDHEGDAFILASSKFGIGAGTDRGSYDGANTLRLERIGQYNDGAFDIDKQKIKSPSIVSSQNGTDKTNLYLAYYDAMNDEIRFKSGTTNKGNVKRDSTTSWVRKVYELDGGGYTGAWVYESENGNNLGCANGDFVYFCDANGNVLDNTPYVIKGLYKDEPTSNTAPASGKKEWAFQITNGNGNSLIPFTSPLGKTSDSYNNYTQGHRGGFKNISGDNVYIKIVKAENTGVTKNFGQFQDSATTSGPSYNTNYVSILASGTTTYKTGAYVSLGVVPSSVTGGNDTVVAVWLDQANPALPILRYAYNSDPVNNPGSWTYVDRVLPASSSYSYAGEYCKVAVDQNGGVHIAAYDQKNLDLIYAYLPASKKGIASSASDFKSCIVDSNGVVGSNLNIDVGINDEGKVVPYISYYATSIIRPKLAYYVGGFSDTDTIEAGAAKDLHTGKWECANVPTESNVEMQSLQHNDINVGLWKDDGVIVDSSSDKYTTGTSSTTNQPNAYNSVSNGQIYGNGTANPVLGYAIKINSKSGAIETAQMK